MPRRKVALTLVTGTRNRPEAFERFLESALRFTKPPFEILVADASDEPLQIEKNGGRVRVLREDPPLGFARGYNRLFAEATGEVVVVLNDDLELLPGWASAVARPFRRSRRLGLLALLNQEPGVDYAFLLRYDDLPLANFAAIRRRVGEAVGWYDESVPFYGPDTDLTLKVYDSTWRVQPLLQPVLFHHKPADAERAARAELLPHADEFLWNKWRARLPALRRRWRAQMASAYDEMSRAWHPGYGTGILIWQGPPERS